jgi:peptide deformylase
MAILDVIKIGHPTLKKVAKKIENITPDLKKLEKDMIDTMFLEEGVGLAAPQINKSIRMIVIDLELVYENEDEPIEGLDKPMAFINPEIISKEKQIFFEEGCLSVPNVREEVARYREIKINFFDTDGNEHTWEVKQELLAVVFQHEIDHLDGILFVDKLSDVKRSMLGLNS